MKIKLLSLRTMVQSIAIMLYFVLLVVHNLYHTKMIDYLWYLILTVCFIFGTIQKRLTFSKNLILFVIIFLIFTILNLIFVGNASLNSIVSIIMYAGIYQLLIDDELDDNFILSAIYIDCIIIAFTIMKMGLGEPVFDELSNNYISVLLLLPTIVYYIRTEYYKNRVFLMPSISVSIICIMAMGRGGIITVALLTASIIWFILSSDRNWKSSYNQTLFRISSIFVGVIILGVVLLYLEKFKTIAVFERFAKFGMYGRGRVGIWQEYITTVSKNLKSILFGAEYSMLPLMVRYKNNLHNSFFNLHADYGIVVLLYSIFLIISNCKKCIKSRKWIYLSVMIVFFLRAFTDKIFGGGSVATPIFIFVLFHIRDKGYEKKTLS